MTAIDIIKKNPTVKNTMITVGILGIAGVICMSLQKLGETDTHVPLLFVLAVLFVSRFTDGYRYGVISSIIAVVGVNYVFTYPYFALDFTLTGYPITFIAMFAVSFSVSALTTQIKKQEKMRLEVEKEKMRANLLRAVSHDIRTPLTSIAGSAAGIIDNKDVLSQEQVLGLVSNIKDEAQWLIRMVENLLSVTRMNEENAKIDTQEELVEEVVSGAVLKFSKRFPDIQVSVDIPEEMLMVPMDAILIEQVLVNLMENSAIHGKTTTEIHLQVYLSEKGAVFSVEDNGQGIEPQVLPDIFERNLSAREGKVYDSKRNMGIGLSVCKSIINAHKGTMKAENCSSGGAAVSFTLPFGREESYGDQG